MSCKKEDRYRVKAFLHNFSKQDFALVTFKCTVVNLVK